VGGGARKVTSIEINSIQLGDTHRACVQSDVDAVADSITRIGLQTPVTVDKNNRLITGYVRYRAFCQLGLERIDCFTVEDHEAARLWNLSENLHRSDLPALEKSEAIAAWAKASDKDGQLDQVIGGRGKMGGLANAARELGLIPNLSNCDSLTIPKSVLL
jgi:ParB-like nuclease domain